MASPMLLKKNAFFAIMCMVLVGTYPLANAAPTCGQMQLMVAPCIGYLRSPVGAVPERCCYGIRTLNNQCTTTPDRQGACRCLKSTALSIPGLNLGALAALPAKCQVNLPYEVSPSIDCNKVH